MLARLAGLSAIAIVTSCECNKSSSASPPASSSSPSPPPPEPKSSYSPGAANGNVVRFVAIGDTGTGREGQQKVADTLATFCARRGCDFIQMLGDNVYETGASSVDDPIFKAAFEAPYAKMNQDFWVVLGNHDYGGSGRGNEFEKGKVEIDYSAKSSKWKLPSAYWHKSPPTSGGKVEIFGLDTNMILYDKAADQKRDIPEWIAASKAEWKIAAGHHPYKSNGPHGNAGVYDRRSVAPGNGEHVLSFFDSAICGKVDLYLAGHDHSRQWLKDKCNGTVLVVSGAGGKSTTLPGKNPSLFESVGLGFVYLVIDGNKLTAEFVDEDGKIEFSHTIEKS